jgi:hypothetical protein
MEALLQKAQLLDEFRPRHVLHFGISDLKLGGEETFYFIELNESIANPEKVHNPEKGGQKQSEDDQRIQPRIALWDECVLQMILYYNFKSNKDKNLNSPFRRKWCTVNCCIAIVEESEIFFFIFSYKKLTHHSQCIGRGRWRKRRQKRTGVGRIGSVGQYM